jgi:hypothetical protein
MAEKKKSGNRSDAGVTIQLHLVGIIVFSVALVLASGLATYGFVKVHGAAGGPNNLPRLYAATNSSGTVELETTNLPPWGQVIVRDIDLEQPEEYAAYEINTNREETWTFEGMNPDSVRSVMQTSGLSAEQIGKALSAASMIYTNSNTVVTPGNDLVFALPPDARAKLYSLLGRFAANTMMQYPFCFPGDAFDARVDKAASVTRPWHCLKKCSIRAATPNASAIWRPCCVAFPTKWSGCRPSRPCRINPPY